MATPYDDDTAEVDEKFYETINIQGREYQKFSIEHDIHFSPIDEEERDRLVQQHKILSIVFENRLLFPPIKNPKRILDCGYGSASWSIEVAEAYPSCQVIGVDLAPQLKPEDTPENFWPQLDNLNHRFTFAANRFDLVNSRLISGGIEADRWPSYLHDIMRTLKPGGWVQMVECYLMCQSDNGSIKDTHAIRQWSNKYFKALGDLKDLRAPLKLANLANAAGFIETDSRMIQLPLSEWPTDEHSKKIGEANRDNAQNCLMSLAVLPLTQKLGMTRLEVDKLVDAARQDAANLSLKAYFPLYVCIGRKPKR